MKNVLATLVGLVVAFIITMGLESLSGVFFPLAEGSDPTNPEWLKANIHTIPTGALIIVAAAHLIGIIIGMYIAALIAKESLIPSYLVGSLLLVGIVVNLMMIPHPTWFMIADFIGGIIGIGIGKTLASRKIQ